ncbi:MAG: DUF4166 domain-containing protein [Stappiaceae bacterium]
MNNSAKKLHQIRAYALERPNSGPIGTKPKLGDLRFRQLLSDTQWASLPHAVRNRFSKRVEGGASAVYVGLIDAVRMNWAGRLLTQVLRLVGAPLPISRDVKVPSVVTVTEDVATHGQVWTRLYGNKQGFPQIIHSAKRFAGPTGLEEYIGAGISIALRTSVENGVLVFSSDQYFMKLGKWKIRLPGIIFPIKLKVTHEETDADAFVFTLTLSHRLLGELIYQAGHYREEQQ